MRTLEAWDRETWKMVREHYDGRVDAHIELIRLHKLGPVDTIDGVDHFSELLLGVSDCAGNYSAAERGLGPKILGSNGTDIRRRLHDLARQFRVLTDPLQVPKITRRAAISYLTIGVGSEVSCMMNPSVCWVANSRSIWMHLVVKHRDNIEKANEALRLYQDGDQSSEMAYRIWSDIHSRVGPDMKKVAAAGVRLALEARVEPGDSEFLWADAIASALYGMHHSR